MVRILGRDGLAWCLRAMIAGRFAEPFPPSGEAGCGLP